MRELKDKNPGTYFVMDTVDEENRFEKLFFAISSGVVNASLCKPVVVLDACHTRHQYGGVIMMACAQDAENSIYPLALALVATETKALWTFFLENLKKVFPAIEQEKWVFVHDNEKGLNGAQKKVFPGSTNSMCVFHLKKNLGNRCNKSVGATITALSNATNKVDFEASWNVLSKLKPAAAAKLTQWRNEGKVWSSFQSTSPRFGIIASNMAESMNHWLGKLRGLHPFPFLVEFVYKLNAKFKRRQAQILQDAELKAFSKKIADAIRTSKDEATAWKVEPVTDGLYRVYRGSFLYNRYVNMSEKTCGCGGFQEHQFPCIHAMAVLLKTNLNIQDYVHPCYLLVSFGRGS